MNHGECTIINESCAVDWKRVNELNELLAKRGAPTGRWKGGILLIDLPKEPNPKPITEKGISNAED